MFVIMCEICGTLNHGSMSICIGCGQLLPNYPETITSQSIIYDSKMLDADSKMIDADLIIQSSLDQMLKGEKINENA